MQMHEKGTHALLVFPVTKLWRQLPADGLVEELQEVGHGELVLVPHAGQGPHQGEEQRAPSCHRVQLVLQHVQVTQDVLRVGQFIGQLMNRCKW